MSIILLSCGSANCSSQRVCWLVVGNSMMTGHKLQFSSVAVSHFGLSTYLQPGWFIQVCIIFEDHSLVSLVHIKLGVQKVFVMILIISTVDDQFMITGEFSI